NLSIVLNIFDFLNSMRVAIYFESFIFGLRNNIFKGTDCDETIRNVRQIIPFIGDFDMLQIGKSLLSKLESMTEEAYNEISFDPTFEE
ncbi:MAG: hypothetical protein IKO19_05445, partial [Candidatus Riflebacteria bacterium]|nr:hypothetical protein [Candidatus Riflebacteria bacterium]